MTDIRNIRDELAERPVATRRSRLVFASITVGAALLGAGAVAGAGLLSGLPSSTPPKPANAEAAPPDELEVKAIAAERAGERFLVNVCDRDSHVALLAAYLDWRKAQWRSVQPGWKDGLGMLAGSEAAFGAQMKRLEDAARHVDPRIEGVLDRLSMKEVRIDTFTLDDAAVTDDLAVAGGPVIGALSWISRLGVDAEVAEVAASGAMMSAHLKRDSALVPHVPEGCEAEERERRRRRID